jgi:DNA polymerase III subunit chi
MTRVDFHSKVPDKLLYACRLIRKARTAGMKVVVYLQDSQQLSDFDQALWTFSEHDFIPHVAASDALAEQTPVILSCDATENLPHHQVLINLSTQTPDHFARFERMFEIVSTDEQDLNAGRSRYKHYQTRGYALTHFEADNS